jgi:flagellar motor switch protein FliN/FliY
MPAELHSILKIEVPVIVQIASRRMPVEDVLKLSPGAIIELPKLADEELEILVANKQIGLGNAVKVGENFGVRVTYVGDVRQRIAALATGNAGDELVASPPDEESGAAIAEQLVPEQQQGAAPA